jgi:hypothetical protein
MSPAGPAASQGDIRVGDALHRVDNTHVAGLDIMQVQALVYGPPGSMVSLTLSSPERPSRPSSAAPASAHLPNAPAVVPPVRPQGAALPEEHGRSSAEVERASRASEPHAQMSEGSVLGGQATRAIEAPAELLSSARRREVFKIDLQRGKPAGDGTRR